VVEGPPGGTRRNDPRHLNLVDLGKSVFVIRRPEGRPPSRRSGTLRKSLEFPAIGNDRRVPIEIRRGRSEDLKRSSGVLGEAFADYPWTRWTVDPDDHQARITRLQLLALENLGLAFGKVWLGSLEATTQSVAVWTGQCSSCPPIDSSFPRSG
jgi:hypothetical protein